MNVFFHGTISAGFEVLKTRIEDHMAGEMGKWVSEYRLADLGDGKVMCAMNVTDMESFGSLISSPEEAQWDIDNGAKYKSYMMEEMQDG